MAINCPIGIKWKTSGIYYNTFQCIKSLLRNKGKCACYLKTGQFINHKIKHMKKFMQLGRKLSKGDQKLIMGGNDTSSESLPAEGGCKGIITCKPEMGCGSIETGKCECKKQSDGSHLCV